MIKLKGIIERLNTKTMSVHTDSYMSEIPPILTMNEFERKDYLDRLSIDNIKKQLDDIKVWYNKYIRQVNQYRDKSVQVVIADLKKRIKQKNSIHDKDIPDYSKSGYGYGGPSNLVYGKRSPDRPYRSDDSSVGNTYLKLYPQI